MARNQSTKSNNKHSGRVRIISGQWRGRWVQFDPLPGLRPTGDRVRETLFNWLQNYPPADHCLDLFAGSGALGIEAASRGARSVTLVDNSLVAVRCIENAIQQLDGHNIHVVQSDAQEFLLRERATSKAAPHLGYDLVFIDPPFADKNPLAYLHQVLEYQLIKVGGCIYIEAGSDVDLLTQLPPNIEKMRDLKSGNMQCVLLRYAS